jgi:hypothetical protein
MKPTELKISNLAKKHRPNTTWPMEIKIQVVSQYLVLGNMALVSAVTKVPHQLIRAWKGQPWWKDVEAQVRATENLQMDNKLSKIVDKSLDAVLDRVENGEYFYDQKLGQVKRKPANLRDVARVSVDILSKRELLRGNATERKETTQVSIDEQLKALAIEFARWQTPNVKPLETLDVIATEIPEQTDEDALGDLPFTEDIDYAEYSGMAREAGEQDKDAGSQEKMAP